MKYQITCECRKKHLGIGSIKPLPQYDLGKITGYGLASYHTDGSICLSWNEGDYVSTNAALTASKNYTFIT